MYRDGAWGGKGVWGVVFWALMSGGDATTGAQAAEGSTTAAARTSAAPPTWSAFRDDVLSGPFTLKVELKKTDNRPAAGKKWELAAGGLMPGDPPRRVVAQGTSPENGIVEISGLAGVESPVTADELKQQRRFAPWYTVWAEGRMLGQVAFFEWGKMGAGNRVEEFLPPADGQKIRVREYRLPPDVGEPAPDVALTDLETSRSLRLTDFRGQVVLLEFWSPKCHSCEGVMEKLQSVAAKREKEWAGKAAILALALDADPASVTRIVTEKGWNSLRHVWSGEGGTGRYSAPAQAFVVTGTPVAVLIGRDGRILWRGSGRELNVEATFEKLLQSSSAP